jgi:hypothetical protein
VRGDVEGLGGNREVPPFELLGGAEASSEEEGGSWERYASWDDTSEPKASEVAA